MPTASHLRVCVRLQYSTSDPIPIRRNRHCILYTPFTLYFCSKCNNAASSFRSASKEPSSIGLESMWEGTSLSRGLIRTSGHPSMCATDSLVRLTVGTAVPAPHSITTAGDPLTCRSRSHWPCRCCCLSVRELSQPQSPNIRMFGRRTEPAASRGTELSGTLSVWGFTSGSSKLPASINFLPA